ncbi:MAG: glycosyltransferase [Patescibacteria group bacterium]
MKIANLVSTFPPHKGGMGLVCEDEAVRLAPEHEVAVFTLAYPNYKYEDEDLSYKIFRLKPFIKIGDGGILRNLEELLRGFDVVHLHYPFYGALGSLIKAKKLLGFKLVVTYHMDAQRAGCLSFANNLYDKIYSKKLFSVADRVIVVDEDYFKASKFGRYIGKDKSVVLPNGVDLSVFKPASIKTWLELGHQELTGKKVILFVGNLLPVKNLQLLIKILPNLDNDARLAIVGGGYAEQSIRDLVNEKKLQDKIIFLGNDVSRELLSDYYRVANVVAIPSLSESFSLVAVEAMAGGAIVAGSEVSGLRGRIKNNEDGFLLKVNNEQIWIDGLNKILNLSEVERQIISERASESAKKYSVEEHMRKLKEVYLAL